MSEPTADVMKPEPVDMPDPLWLIQASNDEIAKRMGTNAWQGLFVREMAKHIDAAIIQRVEEYLKQKDKP